MSIYLPIAEMNVNIFLDKKKYLVNIFLASAQFDGEEQKAGAIASVFFH